MIGSRNSIRFPHKVTIALIALVLTATACGGGKRQLSGFIPEQRHRL